jgi:hypothetical protein
VVDSAARRADITAAVPVGRSFAWFSNDLRRSRLGFEFKQKIEELKRHIDQQVVALRSDIQTHVDLRSQINPQFNIMSPPSDAQLPRIEESIRQALKTELSAFGEKLTPLKPSEELADGDALYLFGVRPSTGPGKSV